MIRFSDNLLEQICNANSIIELIGEYVQLKSVGRNYKALCPFHQEKTPSFIVNPEKQIFHCFGCNIGGNVIHFLMKIQNISFPQAVENLAERGRITLPKYGSNKEIDKAKKEREQIYKINEFVQSYYHQILLKSSKAEKARHYIFEIRKLSPNIVEEFQLGYALADWDDLLLTCRNKGFGENILEKAGLIIPRKTGESGYYDRFREQIIFPIWDNQKRVIGFGGRFLDNREPKYLNSPETMVFSKSQSLYGLNQSLPEIRAQGFIILMEGYMDILRAHQSGITNAVATLGTALTIEQAKIIKRYTSDVVMMYDTDPAGLQATLRGLEPLVSSRLSVKIARLPLGKDPDEFLQQANLDLFYKSIGTALTPIEFALELIIAEYGIEQISQKVKVINMVLPLVDRIGQATERELYLRKIAERVDIDKKSVFSQYQNRQKKSTKNTASTITNTYDMVQKGQLQYEKDLIRFLLNYPLYIPQFKSIINPVDFIDESYRRILDRLFQLDTDIYQCDKINWLNYFNQEIDLVAIISSWMSEDALPESNPEEKFIGYIRKFEKKKILQKQKILKKEIQLAVKSGDCDKLKILQNQFIELQKSIINPLSVNSI